MTKENLIRLKAGLLAVIMCLSLTACSNDKNTKENNKNESSQGEQVDERMFIVAFIEGKAVIYEDTVAASATIREGGYAKIYEDGKYLYYLQIPTLILQGKDNAINFATSMVGEENLVFISWSEEKEGQLVLKPNN